jgi:hypothetical protein
VFIHILVASEKFHNITEMRENNNNVDIATPDMRIVPMGSGGTILDLGWFLNYREIKLIIQVSEIEDRMIS